MNVNLSDLAPFSKSSDDFLGDFWVARIVKLKENRKNICKSDKKNLNDNLVKIINMYFKEWK